MKHENPLYSIVIESRGTVLRTGDKNLAISRFSAYERECFKQGISLWLFADGLDIIKASGREYRGDSTAFAVPTEMDRNAK